MDKENISSTYSPSIYKRAYGLSDVSNTSSRSANGSGFMGMLLSAKEEKVVQMEIMKKVKIT